MNTRYKLCLAITILDWILIPLSAVLIALYVMAILNIEASANPEELSSGALFLIVGAGFVALIEVGISIGSIVCSIMLLVKGDASSPNSGLTIAVGVCGIVFSLANLVLGIILCLKLKEEQENKNHSSPVKLTDQISPAKLPEQNTATKLPE